MGRVGQPPASEVLPTHSLRSATAERRGGVLGAPVRGDCARASRGAGGRMTYFTRLRSFLRALLAPQRVTREIEDDLRRYLAERTDDLIAQGVPPLQANADARRELGDPAKWVEEGREARGTRYVDELRSDVRYALRWLRRSPAVTATAVLSLVIGIGANAAIFNLLDVVVLRSLPVRNPNELVVFSMTTPRGEPMRVFSYRMFRDMQQGSEGLGGMLAFSLTRFSVQ